MLTKQKKILIVKHKLLTARFNRTEVTSLTKQEVLNIYGTTGLQYKLVVWSSSSVTYFKLENSLN